MAKKKPTKKPKAARAKTAKRGERVLLFLVKPGEFTAQEIYEISRKAIDEHQAKRKAKTKRKRSARD